jgi:hypothetical protein
MCAGLLIELDRIGKSKKLIHNNGKVFSRIMHGSVYGPRSRRMLEVYARNFWTLVDTRRGCASR